MKTSSRPGKTTLAALLATVALIAGCGGGGSATTPAPGSTVGPTTTSSNATGGPVKLFAVSAVAARSYSAPADCDRMTSDSAALAALDLGDPAMKQLNDLLQGVDPTHAYKVFIRRPQDFMNWVNSAGSGYATLASVGAGAHETLHMVDNLLRQCNANGFASYLFFGAQLASGNKTGSGDTANYGIVDETIAAPLKSAFRYGTYILSAPKSSGNDFTVLLDEFAAYTAAAYTELQLLNAGKDNGDTSSYDLDAAGMLNFMVWLEQYLQSARLNHPAQYANIKGNAATVAVIQAIWNRAEVVLQAVAPYARPGSAPQLTVDRDYVAAAYSPSLLGELDAVGVTHATAALWKGTYLP